MKTLIAMICLVPFLFGCKTARGPASTQGDAFHGGDSRVFVEQQSNVLMIWSATRRQEPKPKDEK